MDFEEWVAIHFAGDIEYADSWAYNKKHLHEAFEAGRESVIANRETFQNVKAEGIRQGIKEGMERAAVIVRKELQSPAGLFAATAIREEVDNER